MPRVSSVGFSEYEDVAHSIAEEILASNKVLNPADDDAKKLMTVMSGIIDLRSWTLESDQPSLLAPDLRTPVPGLRDLCKELRVDALLGARMLALKTAKRISRLADEIIAGGEVSPLYLFLELVSMLSKKIYQGQEPSSEQDIVQMWKDTLVTLSDGSLRFKTGEKICSATQAAQKDLQERFNVVGETDRGRRVDLLLYSGELELLNSEAKFDASGAVCERQYDKNLRINRAIWNGARRHGLRLPTMHPLDIRGPAAMICTLFSPDNQILLAGAASEDLLELPQDERSLRQFLTVPEDEKEAFMPELLINYTAMLVTYVKDVEVKLSLAKSRKVTTRKRLLCASDNYSNHSTSSGRCNEDDASPAQRPRRVVRPAEGNVTPPPPSSRPSRLGEVTFLTPKKAKEASANGGVMADSHRTSGHK
ncbi:hypothetical protein BGZ70_008426 [Mortierella alpina]|uniref:Uncharacterized protein n=1 Tax=Mortierella alpina TaxID=64518 RepID=A0A9P6J3H6_MORAP|nr:hypothetical protein BGZ70_008426 [Mortierella alpina]